MAGEESPAGFDINGEVYEVPTLDLFDMDEAQILYDLSGVVLEDFIPAHPDADEEVKAAHYQLQLLRVRDPSFKRALVHIAYRRKHEEYDFAELDKAIGKMNAPDISTAVFSRGGEDPTQDSPSKPDEKKSTNGTSESSSSGSPSESDSERRALTLAPTGTSPLGTSYQESPPTLETSAS